MLCQDEGSRRSVSKQSGKSPCSLLVVRIFCLWGGVGNVPAGSGITRLCPRQLRRADSGSGIHRLGYRITASSLGFCEAKLRSFPPTAKSGLGQVAKGVPVGLSPLKWTPYPCGDVVPQNPLRGIRPHHAFGKKDFQSCFPKRLDLNFMLSNPHSSVTLDFKG